MFNPQRLINQLHKTITFSERTGVYWVNIIKFSFVDFKDSFHFLMRSFSDSFSIPETNKENSCKWVANNPKSFGRRRKFTNLRIFQHIRERNQRPIPPRLPGLHPHKTPTHQPELPPLPPEPPPPQLLRPRGKPALLRLPPPPLLHPAPPRRAGGLRQEPRRRRVAQHPRDAQLHPLDGREDQARVDDPPAAQHPGPDQRVAAQAGRRHRPEEGRQRDHDARGAADRGQGGGGEEAGGGRGERCEEAGGGRAAEGGRRGGDQGQRAGGGGEGQDGEVAAW